jgi:hypothetical protein
VLQSGSEKGVQTVRTNFVIALASAVMAIAVVGYSRWPLFSQWTNRVLGSTASASALTVGDNFQVTDYLGMR